MIPNAAAKASLTPEQLDVVTKLVTKFIELQVEAEFVPPVMVGPVISTYKFRPTGRTRVSNIENMAEDFSVTLGVEDVLVKRRPGDSAVSLSVPNAVRHDVDFKDSVTAAMRLIAAAHAARPFHIPLNLGQDEQGQPFVDDLADLPHLLIAGQTFGGKSVLLRSILGTIVYMMNSRDVQLCLSDTKLVEFGAFEDAPHLAFPVAKTAYQTFERMQWIIDVMEDRLKIIAAAGKQNIADYNKVAKLLGGNKMPYIVLVIDEIADLMGDGKKGKSSEATIATKLLGKIVQKARAAGAHVIAATQRASVDVVAGIVKANFTARLSFRSASGTDSRTILDQPGAEHLLARGDCLYLSPMRQGLVRLHSAFAKVDDVRGAIEYAKAREAGLAP
jgi:DNA segregation ATPase FtsK/SpoIIIE, S-DNA-T family